MKLDKIRIGFAITGSFCTIDKVMIQVKNMLNYGAEVFPIISNSVCFTDTRFGTSQQIKENLKEITGNNVICSITEAEPIGPQKILDALVIAPCTGNTISKIATGITDTPVTMACKAHLRNQRPVIICISTNDGLSANAKNIGALLNTKNIFMVPFGQDDPGNKPNSIVANTELIIPTVEAALDGIQIQPLLGL